MIQRQSAARWPSMCRQCGVHAAIRPGGECPACKQGGWSAKELTSRALFVRFMAEDQKYADIKQLFLSRWYGSTTRCAHVQRIVAVFNPELYCRNIEARGALFRRLGEDVNERRLFWTRYPRVVCNVLDTLLPCDGDACELCTIMRRGIPVEAFADRSAISLSYTPPAPEPELGRQHVCITCKATLGDCEWVRDADAAQRHCGRDALVVESANPITYVFDPRLVLSIYLIVFAS